MLCPFRPCCECSSTRTFSGTLVSQKSQPNTATVENTQWVNHANMDNLILVKFTNSPPLEATLLNAPSICNTPLLINSYVVMHQLYIAGMTETWLKSENDGVTIAAV